MIAVPKNIEAIGNVASIGVFAIFAPARPPIVITITETVWNRACELAKIRT
jgi:tRNA (Thr-GGU) A37 N-methylase